MTLSPSRCLRRGGLALVVATVLSSSCASDSPQAQLAGALKSTLRTSFAYEFAVQADREALAALGPEGAEAGLFLQGLEISGRRAGDGDALTVRVAGVDVFELRSIDEDTFYLRFGFDDLAAAVGWGDPSARIIPLVRERGVSDEAIEAVSAAFRGRWVGIEGKVEAAELRAILSGEAGAESPVEQSESVREALGGDVDGFVERCVVVNDVSGGDDERIFDVRIRVRDLVRAVTSVEVTSQVHDLEAVLHALPELAPGTITTREGAVTSLLADLARAPHATGEHVNGSVTVRLDLSQHGEVEDIEPPREVVTITDEQFLEALRATSGLVEDLAPPAPVPPPPPAATASGERSHLRDRRVEHAWGL